MAMILEDVEDESSPNHEVIFFLNSDSDYDADYDDSYCMELHHDDSSCM